MTNSSFGEWWFEIFFLPVLSITPLMAILCALPSVYGYSGQSWIECTYFILSRIRAGTVSFKVYI